MHAGLGQAGPSGTVISDPQKAIHLASELAAVLMVPAMFSAARAAKGKHRAFLRFLAWGTLIVDGGLLINWWLKRRR